MISQSPAVDYGRLAEVLAWAEEVTASSDHKADGGQADCTAALAWLDDFIDRHSIAVQRREPWNGGWRLIVNECPFNAEHKGSSAALLVGANGRIGFKCQHNGCAGKNWREVRQKFEPTPTNNYAPHAEDSGTKSWTNGKGADKPSRVDIDEIPAVHSFSSTGIEFVIEGLIARGSVNMLSGESGHGKSTLVTVMAYAIAQGRDFAGRKCCPRPVLILDRENGIDVLQERLARLGIEDEHGLKVWGGWLECEAPSPGASVILEWVSRTEPKPVIVVDSVIAFLEGDENSATAVRGFMSQLRQLANLGATVIVLHHTGKAETSQEYRGSSDFKGSIDVGINVRNYGEGELGKIRLMAFKNRFSIDRSVILNYRDGQFIADERPNSLLRTVTEQLTDLLRRNPGVKKAEFESLAASLRLGRNRARAFLDEGVQVGEIQLVEGKKNAKFYRLVELADAGLPS